jgi:hypothetical protein
MVKVALLISALISAATAPTVAAASSPVAGVCGEVAPQYQSQLPFTAAVVQLAKDWVETINSADDAAYLGFVEARGPVWGESPDQALAMRDFLRGMKVCGVKSAKADAVELWTFDPGLDSFGFWLFKPGASSAD